MGGDEGPELKDHSLVGEEKEQLKTELYLALSPTITKPFKARRVNQINVQSLAVPFTHLSEESKALRTL